ncbi:hypothetical protein HY501_02160, partial [Candidatus Woesearchaeota archaeon]|nr:hypothetical protein [Candidatus Woesearchaeota archaeon]
MVDDPNDRVPELHDLREVNDQAREFRKTLDDAVGVLDQRRGYGNIFFNPYYDVGTNEIGFMPQSPIPFDTCCEPSLDDQKIYMVDDTKYAVMPTDPTIHVPLMDKREEPDLPKLPTKELTQLRDLGKQLDRKDLLGFLSPDERKNYDRVTEACRKIGRHREKQLSVLEWLVVPPEEPIGGTVRSRDRFKAMFPSLGLSMCSPAQLYHAAESLKDILQDNAGLYGEGEKGRAQLKRDNIRDCVRLNHVALRAKFETHITIRGDGKRWYNWYIDHHVHDVLLTMDDDAQHLLLPAQYTLEFCWLTNRVGQKQTNAQLYRTDAYVKTADGLCDVLFGLGSHDEQERDIFFEAMAYLFGIHKKMIVLDVSKDKKMYASALTIHGGFEADKAPNTKPSIRISNDYHHSKISGFKNEGVDLFVQPCLAFGVKQDI